MPLAIPNDLPTGPRSLQSAFLVGAPRCGTTYLAKALARHPNVCFSKPKETHFFARDAPALPPERWRDEFLRRHFAARLDARHTLLAEGSPLSLRDPRAIERLLQFDPETRFVVAIRNPIEMAHSFHARLVYLLDEDEPDFERAWALQDVRASGKRLPRRCRDAAALQYRSMASLGTQLGALIARAGRTRVHVVVFDDILSDPLKVHRALLEFLELPDDGRTRFPRKNTHREYRHGWAQALVTNPPRPLARWLAARERQGKPKPQWVRELRRRIKRWNTRRAKRSPISEPMRARLHAELGGEIERLERLLGRDFSHWR